MKIPSITCERGTIATLAELLTCVYSYNYIKKGVLYLSGHEGHDSVCVYLNDSGTLCYENEAVLGDTQLELPNTFIDALRLIMMYAPLSVMNDNQRPINIFFKKMYGEKYDKFKKASPFPVHLYSNTESVEVVVHIPYNPFAPDPKPVLDESVRVTVGGLMANLGSHDAHVNFHSNSLTVYELKISLTSYVLQEWYFDYLLECLEKIAKAMDYKDVNKETGWSIKKQEYVLTVPVTD